MEEEEAAAETGLEAGGVEPVEPEAVFSLSSPSAGP